MLPAPGRISKDGRNKAPTEGKDRRQWCPSSNDMRDFCRARQRTAYKQPSAQVQSSGGKPGRQSKQTATRGGIGRARGETAKKAPKERGG